MAKVTVVGAGAYGTSLALYAQRTGHQVRMWCFEKDLPGIVAETGENQTYLPGFPIPKELQITNDMQAALDGAELVLLVVPSAHMRRTSEAAAPLIPKTAMVASAAKGIENGSLELMSQILETTLKERADELVYLSGPSFAKDVASGLPTDLACASHSAEAARKVQDILHSTSLRFYTSDDVIGVELGGALKNVIAIACGAADGFGMGASAQASLITRGLAEITRLGVAMGAKPLTFLGLSGVGDLVLTCGGDLSRNRTLGKRIAAGEKAADVVASQKSVAEGYVTCKAGNDLAVKLKVDMPITTGVYRVCHENADIKVEAQKLLTREKKGELHGIQ